MTKVDASECGEIYTGFAEVYDLFMDDVPYREWAGRIGGLLAAEGITDGLVLDLCCGTGKLTRLLSGMGYEMIGVDRSAEMLMIAREAEEAEALPEPSADETEEAEALPGQFADEPHILYLCQDMRRLELYGTVRAVVCACDSLNYILSEDELAAVFRLVSNYLDPGGLFLFDLNTPYKYERLLADNTFAENRGEGSFIWENEYDSESGINRYDLTLYIRSRQGNTYRRFEETHLQSCYALADIKKLLAEAGLAFVTAYDGYEARRLTDESERMLILAREIRKAR